MRPAFAILATLALGCESPAANPAPRTRLHFPTGLAVDHEYDGDGGIAHALYVAGFSNFDLQYDTGLLYALDLDAMFAGADWDAGVLQLPDLADAGFWDRDSGVVLTDSMGGELRLVQTSDGGRRLFLASRYANVVTAIDVPSPDQLVCFGGGLDCTNPTAAPPIDIQIAGTLGNQVIDVFGLSNPITTSTGERDLFVTHMRDLGYGSNGLTVAYYGNNTSQLGEDFLIRQNIDTPSLRIADPIGPTGASSSVAFASGGSVYALVTGRYGGGITGMTNGIRTLTTPDSLVCEPPDAGMVAVDPNLLPFVGTIDLTSSVKGNDGRGMAIGAKTYGGWPRVYALTRNPDALVVMQVDGFLSYGPSVHVSTVVSVLPGPTELLVLPRTDRAGNPIGDLVVISCADVDSLAFYDDELGIVSAALPGVGNLPFAMVATSRTSGTGATAQVLPGARIFATAFGSGQIAVVDVPDLLDAQTAQVVAMIGTFEDTSVSPINPDQTTTVFMNAFGGGPAGIP